MKIEYCEQRSPEWMLLRKGSIGGKRFGNVISGKKNRLVYDLLNERLSDFVEEDDYIDDAMQFGLDNEQAAIDLYSKMTGIQVERIGLIQSDFSLIHHASPDGISLDHKIIQEVKCTEDGGIHIQRFFDGVETSHLPQIKNYFAVSNEVERVDWISFCPYRQERPLIIIRYYREDFTDIEKGRDAIKRIEIELEEMYNKFIF